MASGTRTAPGAPADESTELALAARNFDHPLKQLMGVRDDKLVSAALAGDPAAFATLVEQSRARVESVVERMVGEEAEDLVQEALLRAYLGLSQLRDPARFSAWLCGIAVNLAKMRLRRRAVEARVVVDATCDGGLEERELLEVVRDAVEILPPGQRDAVLMHYIEGLSCEEIAAVLETSPGAIRVRLHRARQQLRKQLAPLAPSPTPKEEIHMLEMRLEDVIVRVAEDDPMKLVADQRIVLLKEADGERLLPIWIGAPEGNALALRLTGEKTPRPVTSDVMAELVRVTGARVERVAVTSLREKTFYAVIAVAVDGRVDELDARPSDALNLAVRIGAPIFVEDSVLEENAMPADDLPARLEDEAKKAEHEVPPGEWRSLSAELLQSLYRWR
jgi:RNA polymerase sigma factor (sigma-70 family)